MKKAAPTNVLWLSLPLALLIVSVSMSGLLDPDAYSKESANWQQQSMVQDVFDLLLIVPFLVVSALYAYRKYSAALFIWGGILIYLVYTFTIYCFSIHYGKLFVPYCLILGLSFYSLLYFFNIEVGKVFPKVSLSSAPRQVTWIYFVVISLLFYFFWIAEIVSALASHTLPPSLKAAGLVTNPVYVLDLSICLPGIFISGMLLRNKKKIGLILAPVILTFFVFIDLTIATMMTASYVNEKDGSLPVAVIMIILAAGSIFLLWWNIRSYWD